MFHNIKESPDALTAEWWDFNILNPKPGPKIDPSTALDALNLDPTALRDMAIETLNPQHILPEQYRTTSDNVNLLLSQIELKEDDSLPHDRVQELIDATANYVAEDQKYYNLTSKPGQQEETLGDISQGVSDIREAIDFMAAQDMRMDPGVAAL